MTAIAFTCGCTVTLNWSTMSRLSSLIICVRIILAWSCSLTLSAIGFCFQTSTLKLLPDFGWNAADILSRCH